MSCRKTMEHKENKDIESKKANSEHPAGRFMWSAALGGPIVSWIVHMKELKGASFFAVLLAVNLIFVVGYKFVGGLWDYKEHPLLALPLCLGYIVARSCALGLVGAKKMQSEAPNYNTQDYRRREKWGIIFGALYTGLAIVEGILGTH